MSPVALEHPLTAPRDRTLTTDSVSGVIVGAGATGVAYFGAETGYGAARGWLLLTGDEHLRGLIDLRLPDGFRYESGVLDDEETVEVDELERAALEAARLQPAIESTPGPVPELTGNLVEDTRALTGLTAKEFGELFGRTERAGQEWRHRGVPDKLRPRVEALRAIGLTLVGGLGPDGVKRWLLSGDPSPWERIKRGEIAHVAEEVRTLEDSLAT